MDSLRLIITSVRIRIGFTMTICEILVGPSVALALGFSGQQC